MRWSVGTSSRVPKPVVGEVINLRLVTSHWAIEHAHRTQLLLALVHSRIHFGQMCPLTGHWPCWPPAGLCLQRVRAALDTDPKDEDARPASLEDDPTYQ